MSKEKKKSRGDHPRPWPQWAVLILLLVQVLGLGFVVWLHINTSEVINPADTNLDALAQALVDVIALSIALAVIIISALLAMISILRWRGNAWMLALLVEGISLGLGLALYVGERPFYTYLIMLYGVIVVVYLMLPGVQAAFLPLGGQNE